MSAMTGKSRQRAISEVAKLMLKLSPVEIIASKCTIDHAGKGIFEELLKMQDLVPSFVLSYRETDSDSNFLEIRRGSKVISSISFEMPNQVDRVWIPMEEKEFVVEVSKLILKFSEAGYPGCESCLGDDLNAPWDEEGSRASMLQFI
tara:strand:- start:1305 stop:1745 length:441 start_codon:yes stop_codon:yes gene_type:complete